MNCNIGYMLDINNHTCISETNTYQNLRDIANCTKPNI